MREVHAREQVVLVHEVERLGTDELQEGTGVVKVEIEVMVLELEQDEGQLEAVGFRLVVILFILHVARDDAVEGDVLLEQFVQQLVLVVVGDSQALDLQGLLAFLFFQILQFQF